MLAGTTIAVNVRGKPRRSAAPLFFLPRKPQSLAILPRSKNLANRNFFGRRGAFAAICLGVLPQPVLSCSVAGHLSPWSKEMSDKLFDNKILGFTQLSSPPFQAIC
jgi:hypothetical protein